MHFPGLQQRGAQQREPETAHYGMTTEYSSYRGRRLRSLGRDAVVAQMAKPVFGGAANCISFHPVLAGTKGRYQTMLINLLVDGNPAHLGNITLSIARAK